MAFSSKGHTQTALAEINITPLVDVVLVLLLIFMLTAPVLQSGVEVAIPKTRTVNQLTEERMALQVLALSESGDAEHAQELAVKFRARYPGSLLMPAVDAAAPAR